MVSQAKSRKIPTRNTCILPLLLASRAPPLVPALVRGAPAPAPDATVGDLGGEHGHAISNHSCWHVLAALARGVVTVLARAAASASLVFPADHSRLRVVRLLVACSVASFVVPVAAMGDSGSGAVAVVGVATAVASATAAVLYGAGAGLGNTNAQADADAGGEPGHVADWVEILETTQQLTATLEKIDMFYSNRGRGTRSGPHLARTASIIVHLPLGFAWMR